MIGDVHSDLQSLSDADIRGKQGLLSVKLLEYGVAWARLTLLPRSILLHLSGWLPVGREDPGATA